MQIPSAIVTLVIGMLLALGGLWIGQNINLLPIDASVNAPIYDELFQVLFTIGTILFVGIVGLLVYSLIRFRRRSGQLGDGIAIEGNLPLEIFWTALGGEDLWHGTDIAIKAHGEGNVILSALILRRKVAHDPVAQLLLSNLLRYSDSLHAQKASEAMRPETAANTAQ